MCTLLARCLVGFIERIFLARCSIEALEGGMTGVFLSNVFQSACINMGNMTQVFLGERLKGDQKDIFGKVSWQMIWFSLMRLNILALPSFWSTQNCERVLRPSPWEGHPFDSLTFSPSL